MKNNYFIIVLLFVLILTACENITGYIGRNNIENSIDRLNSNYKKLENNSITKGSIKEFKGHSQHNAPDYVERVNNNYFDIGYNSERANRIAKMINDFPEVKKSTIIITGNTALIGIETTEGLNEKEIEKLKKQIENKVYSSDISLKNIGITSSSEIITRMNKISNSIKNMEPVNGLANELSSIIIETVPKI
ncbi:MAG: hypothetical protein GX327_05935 [Epulopiscium sp.]|nr:hypothetical protein [Candidatus Epulonipiscium sp.]